MECRITTLADNTVGIVHGIGEWGFSALVETDEMNVLFDTGEGYGILRNAELLGIDLTKIDKIVISHSHFDHTGGLPQILRKLRKETEVIAAPDLWAEKYSVREGKGYRYNGIPYVRPELESLGARFTLTQEPVRLTNNIMTSGEIPIVTDFEKVGADYLLVKEGNKYRVDDFSDDRALVIKTEVGLVVILGCAHRCLINTLYHTQKLAGRQQIHTVVGGCHLFDASEDRIRKTVAALKELNVQRVGMSHCTGLQSAAIMAQELAGRFFFNTVGSQFSL